MDSDLSFLRQASNEDLDPLVGYILNAEISESLSDSDEYKRHHPDHRQYVDLIDREIRDFGGNRSRPSKTPSFYRFWPKPGHK